MIKEVSAFSTLLLGFTLTILVGCTSEVSWSREGGGIRGAFANTTGIKGINAAGAAGSSSNTIYAGADIASGGMTTSFDVSNFSMTLNTTNVSIATTSGQFTLTLLQSGSVIASANYNFYVVNGSLYPSNPGAVNAWLSGYAGVADEINISAAVDTVPTTTATTTATAVNTISYSGNTLASGTKTWQINTFTCPVKLPNCQQP